MNEEIYFKVCSIVGELKMSAFSEYTKLIYSFDYWTEPKIKNSKLFVFKDPESAKEFMGDFQINHRIFSCICKNPQSAPPLIVGFTDLYDIKIFWDRYLIVPINKIASLPVPPGTMVADAVKLIKEVLDG